MSDGPFTPNILEGIRMKTYFASPGRLSRHALYDQVRSVTQSPFVNGVMDLAGGLIAVLNQHRQILALNHHLLTLLGIRDPEAVLGLRPGEALGCAYAKQMEGGCGTSAYCMTCGAAIAIVSSQVDQETIKRDCALKVEKNGQRSDLYFRVMASPIKIESEQFVLIFLHDRTRQQYHAALERAFFQDIKNTISGLLTAGEVLALNADSKNGCKDMARVIVRLTERLNREVELQRQLSHATDGNMRIEHQLLTVELIMNETREAIRHHPSRQKKHIRTTGNLPQVIIRTDISLLVRALSNMLINACEASNPEQEILFGASVKKGEIVFSVWNDHFLPYPVQKRIFQRNFSTREAMGRGLGTYSMKLISEHLLNGRVYFETSPEGGTTFYLCLPAEK